MKIPKLITSLIMAAAVALSCMPVEAAVKVPDLSKQCSVTINLTDKTTKEALSGGSIALYKVGDAKQGESPNTGDYYFDYTEAFKAVESDDLKAKDSAALSEYSLAAKYLTDAKTASIAVASTQEIANGTVKFGGLAAGLYLVAQGEDTPGYKPISPYLVTLPYNDGENGYIYDLTSAPKTQLATSTDKLVPCEVDPPVKKAVNGDGAPTETFQVVFTRLSQEYPMPVNAAAISSTDNEITIGVANNATVEIGNIKFTKAGDYLYQLTEKNTGVSGFSYDSTIYWYKFEVRSDGEKLYVSNLTVKSGGPNGSTVYSGTDVAAAAITFTNTYTKPTPPPTPNDDTNPGNSETITTSDGDTGNVLGARRLLSAPQEAPAVLGASRDKDTPRVLGASRLPQTGQLWWPVAVMAALGLVLVLLGVRTRKNAE